MDVLNVIYPNGVSQTFKTDEFIQCGNELEHKKLNIILNLSEPHKSFIYEMDFRGEIIHKDNLLFNIV